jgi:hypothetical protein
MSPEQASGDPVDGRSDLFSLGAVAYQLLTGRQAFRAENVMQVLSRVVNDTPAPPSHLVPGLPEGVDRVIARAMAKQPDRRYPSGEDMAADIDALIACRPPSAADELSALLLDDDDPLAAVLEPPAIATAPSRPSPPPRPAAAAASRTVSGPLGTLAEPIPLPQRRSPTWDVASWARRPTLWMGLAAAALLLLAVKAMWPDGPPEPRRAPVEATARPAPRAADPTPEPPAVAEEGEGLLEVDFEHHLRKGRIQVWVDEDEVLNEEFDSRVTKKILSLRLRKGAVQQVLPIPAGRHEVRVRVQWDKVRTRRISATFEPGRTRTLRVRVSRIFNDLSLAWE